MVDKHLEHLSGTIALAETEGGEAEPVGKDSWGESSIENWFGDWWHLCIHCLGQRPAGGAVGIVVHTCRSSIMGIARWEWMQRKKLKTALLWKYDMLTLKQR